MRILFCRIGWAKYYDGDINDIPQKGGEFTENNIGFEFYNAKSYSGTYYGYAKTQGRIHFEKIEAHYSQFAKTMENVLVVWFAKNPLGGQFVVGWYKNATVFRNWQSIDNSILKERNEKSIKKYIAKSNSVKFLAESERTFEITGAGQNNIFYGNELLKANFLNYINEISENSK